MKVGVLTISIALLLSVAAWAGPAADNDSDGTPDLVDCCINPPYVAGPILPNQVPSSYSCDIDTDGYCGPCDGDFNQDGVVDGFDFGPFSADLSVGSDSGVGSDMNCDGVVDGFDLAPFSAQLSGGYPGPSGFPCAGTSPCP